MDETTWLACTDPQAMLRFLWGKASDRKQRLFAVASCRRIWPLLSDERSRQAVEVAERYVDAQATEEELELAAAAASDVWDAEMERLATEGKWDRRSLSPPYTASAAAYNVALPLGWWGGAPAFVAPDAIVREVTADGGTEGGEQCVLLRDLFGSPFRPRVLDPSWLAWDDGTVVRLAQAAYDNRTVPAGTLHPLRLAVLADALEEAGCTDSDILGHLRSPGPHMRGCWPVDLLLGKS
jgi:hypothetical protein